jgi:anti-sigma B factor antagonist
MPLEIQQREREGITVLELHGRITVGPEASAVRDACTRLATEGKGKIVLELGDVDFIDSTGLGALVICSTALRKTGGAVKLVNVNRRNIELLVMTKLATVFEIYPDEQDAINSFYPDRQVKTFDILDFVQKMKQDD